MENVLPVDGASMPQGIAVLAHHYRRGPAGGGAAYWDHHSTPDMPHSPLLAVVISALTHQPNRPDGPNQLDSLCCQNLIWAAWFPRCRNLFQKVCRRLEPSFFQVSEDDVLQATAMPPP